MHSSQLGVPQKPSDFSCKDLFAGWKKLTQVALLFIYSLPVLAGPDERTTIKLWRHETGQDEMRASAEAVRRFNQSQTNWRIETESLPQGSYTQAITAAALAKQLPCILSVDQPIVPNFAWSGHLIPLEGLLDSAITDNLINSAKGFYKNRLYSVGQFDVALALFARRSDLADAGVRIATLDSPYSIAELTNVLETLKRRKPDQFPLDLHSNWRGEWLSYAFSPWLQSAGADLINRKDYISAEGTLNSPDAVTVVEQYAALFRNGLVEKQIANEQGFLIGLSAMQYTGSWSAKPFSEALGEELVIMPPPDFGQGPVIGSGSWQWGISRMCSHPKGAAAFLNFILTDPEIATMSETTGLVPVTVGAAEITENYRDGGAWRIFFDLSRRFSKHRPATPAYPIISSAFGKAMLEVRYGTDAETALDYAVDKIEHNIYRNRGYGFTLGTAK